MKRRSRWSCTGLFWRPLSRVSCELLCVGAGPSVYAVTWRRPTRPELGFRAANRFSEKMASQLVEIGPASRCACPEVLQESWRNELLSASGVAAFSWPSQDQTQRSRNEKVPRTQFASFVHDVLLERVSVRRSSYQERALVNAPW